MLYQALAIEHPEINFSFILPGTIEGNFRASAVDIEEGERARGQMSEGLKREDVAKRIVQAVDWREKFVWMPSWYRWAHALYWIWPSFIERKASRKYNFVA
jgi:short-subunit dehydrogenase